MSKYILSIIIPTKNRQKYLIHSIEQILPLVGDDVEIVVQDNSDEKYLQSHPTIVENENVTYNYVPGTLSFVDNFSRAVSCASGEFVCIIGDDDGITKFLYPTVKWASEHGIEAIRPAVAFEYFWPNSIGLKGMSPNGIVRILFDKLKLKYVKPRKSIENLFKNGCQDYTYSDTVKIYHGIVLKKKLDIIKEKTGHYFGGLTPDIYSAISLSLITNKMLKISVPLTIAGVCPTSGSADSSNGKHVGKYEEAPHLRGHDQYDWSELVPKFYSVETIWADSAIAAAKDMGEEKIIKMFNLAKCCGYSKFFHKDYQQEIDVFFKEKLNDKKIMTRMKLRIQYTIFPITYFAKRLFRRLKRFNKKLILEENIVDIIKAENFYDLKANISIDELLKKLVKNEKGYSDVNIEG